ncbi:hypothetical protein LG329_15330 [Virgibacillus necropolis]
MKKKREEIPTFTILNPDFHGPENVVMDSGVNQEIDEEVVSQDENYQG